MWLYVQVFCGFCQIFKTFTQNVRLIYHIWLNQQTEPEEIKYWSPFFYTRILCSLSSLDSKWWTINCVNFFSLDTFLLSLAVIKTNSYPSPCFWSGVLSGHDNLAVCFSAAVKDADVKIERRPLHRLTLTRFQKLFWPQRLNDIFQSENNWQHVSVNHNTTKVYEIALM